MGQTEDGINILGSVSFWDQYLGISIILEDTDPKILIPSSVGGELDSIVVSVPCE